MNLLVIDPGLASRHGHNMSVAVELAAEAASRADMRLTIAASAALDPSAFGDLPALMLPAFRLHGYQKLTGRAVADAATLAELRRVVDEDLDALGLQDYDAIVMHTVYPLHLEGLARHAATLRARLTCGFLMPPWFWDGDGMTRAWIGRTMEASIHALFAQADVLAYSETGSYPFGGAPTGMSTLLPPLSARSDALMARLEASAAPTGERVRFGFFGAPFVSKGFEHVEALALGGLPEHAELVVRLPDGYEAVRDRLAGCGPRVDASSRPMSNEAFLAEMAGVDVVLAPYDPAQYGDKMSGIVPEAICLGKAVLLAQGCHAVAEFLERYAPGSYAQCGFDAASVAQAIALPPHAWGGLRRRAAASAALVRHMKSADRYLRLAGADDAR